MLQQRMSKLQPFVTVGNYTGKDAVVAKQLGDVEFDEIVGRFTDTVLTDIEHDQRWVGYKRHGATLPVTEADVLQMVESSESLRSMYRNALADAYERKLDDIIIPAISGTSYAGPEYGTTPKTLPATQKVAADFGASSATGLTSDKLFHVNERFMENEANLDAEGLILVIGPKQATELKKENLFSNADFIRFGEDMGSYKPNNPLGMKLIISNKLQKSGSNRKCLAYLKSGVHLGIWQGFDVKASERPDKNYDWQIQAQCAMGATRLQEKKVIEIACAEA